ncbi:MAG: methionine--tRNA ligase, partial [Dermatophilaceae bacterium]|nr:methionine--tRNA ligase [Dermatophilaceae bacterium]
RNNSELVAGWGNLVNRTAAMIAKSFGEIPRAGAGPQGRNAVEPVDEELLATVRGAFATVGGNLERHRQKAALAEVMRVVGEANAYVSKTEPFKLKGDDQRERLATVLHTLVQAVSDINTLISPFLPHAANRVHAVLGGEGEFMPMPRLDVVRDLDDESRSYPVITGEYTATPRWEPRPVVPGTPIKKPTGVFTKLDADTVIEAERARLSEPATTDPAQSA